MSEITAELLRAMVPRTKGQMIDELIGPLNLVLPFYGITTELRVSGFLATAAPESDWFKTLREYGKGKGRAYGKPDRITGLVYYGRGIFQNTWKRGYQKFTSYVRDNWDHIKDRAAAFGFTHAPDFVANPELLAEPYWAVEAACWYWQENGLEAYADRGLKGFYGLQGLVNRGSAGKTALGYYEERLPAYEKIRKLLPDDFTVSTAQTDSAEPDPLSEPTNAAETGDTPAKSTTLLDEAGIPDNPNKIETVSEKFSWLQGPLDKFGVSIPDAKTSRDTWLMLGLKGIVAMFFTALGLLRHNWVWVAAAVAVIALIVVAYKWSRDRVHADKAGVPVHVLEAAVAASKKE